MGSNGAPRSQCGSAVSCSRTRLFDPIVRYSNVIRPCEDADPLITYQAIRRSKFGLPGSLAPRRGDDRCAAGPFM